MYIYAYNTFGTSTQIQGTDDQAQQYTGEHNNTNTDFESGIHGRWWPIWLVCRTKTGWWTMCWYQLLDGHEVVELWWYADCHVHIIDVLH